MCVGVAYSTCTTNIWKVDYVNLLIPRYGSGGHEGIDPKAYRTS